MQFKESKICLLIILTLTVHAPIYVLSWVSTTNATHYKVTVEGLNYTNSDIVKTNSYTVTNKEPWRFSFIPITNKLKAPILK